MVRLPIDRSFDLKKIGDSIFLLPSKYDYGCARVLQEELNTFFTNITCDRVIFTNNDKLLFGINVLPKLNDINVLYKYADSTEGFMYEPIATNYTIEYDSKLFDSSITSMLTPGELCALTLYSIHRTMYYDFLNIHSVIDEFCDMHYMPNIIDTFPKRELLLYGLKSALIKRGNPLYEKDGYLTTRLAVLVNDTGYTGLMYSALKKIVESFNFLQGSYDDRYIALSWVLRVIKDYETMRAPAYKTLLRASELTGSELEKDIILKAANVINNAQSMNESVGETHTIGYNDILTIRERLLELNELAKVIADRNSEDDMLNYHIETYNKVYREVMDHMSTVIAFLNADCCSQGERSVAEDVLSELESIKVICDSEKEHFEHLGKSVLCYDLE